MPDAVLYLVSQPYLSGLRLRQLCEGLVAATPVPAEVVRMEGAGESAMDALFRLTFDGARNILVQPVGLPFSDSLMAWLPDALGHWQRTCGVDGVTLTLARDQIDQASVLCALVDAALAGAQRAMPVRAETGTIEGKGWDTVPDHSDHLLVCGGPRCSFRRAGSLRDVLNAELSRQKVMRRTLVATTGCLFPCNKGPVVAHYPAGRWYRLATPADVARFVSTVLVARRPLPEFLVHEVKSHDLA